MSNFCMITRGVQQTLAFIQLHDKHKTCRETNLHTVIGQVPGMWCTVTLTPLSLRSGVRAGVMGVLLLEGNMLGAVGLRNGALGIPFSGAEEMKSRIIIVYCMCVCVCVRRGVTDLRVHK